MPNYQVTVAITQYVNLIVHADSGFEAEDAADQYASDHLPELQARNNIFHVTALPANISAVVEPDLAAVAGRYAKWYG